MERVSVRLNQQDVGAGLAISANAVIRDSVINSNGGGQGGGIFISFSSPFTVSIESSTISSNTTSSFGGGIMSNSGSPNAVVILSNVTVASNSAGTGGGIHNGSTDTVVLRNTIVANNMATTSHLNCSGTIQSQGHNLVFNGGGDTCGLGGNGDIVNTGDPKLSALQGNGGPTATHTLGFGSAALDKGDSATPGSGGTACEANDQRGLPRTIDGDGDGITRCDIGAVEGGHWYAVDTTTDSNAAGFQVCDTDVSNGNCSLRGAISVANAAGTSAVITLPPTGAGNPYRLTLPGAGEDLNATGDLDIQADITIVGGGATTTIVDGNQIDRVFHVTNWDFFTRLALQDLTVQNGNAGAAGGGGIFAERPFSLLRVRMRANTARSGGGISLVGRDGAITDSTVSGNTTTAGGVGGGGITQSSSGTLTITNSTIAQNQTVNGGGGLFQFGAVTTILRNVTIAGNSAAAAGGVLQSGTVSVVNTIIAGNTAGVSGSPNCGGTGTPTSQGYNLVFGGDTCGFTQGTDKQNQSFDPRLGPLQFNGGPTETMALQGGSAAIDAGNPAIPLDGQGARCTAADQRGTARPIDGDTVNGPRCDIGAYEAAVCTTRPNVALGVAPGVPGRITVNVTAGSGNIVELRLHALASTNILVNVGSGDQSGELIVPVNAPSKQFTMRRASGVGAGTLPFDVVDGCGLWHTLAGGGVAAWHTGNGPVSEASATEMPSAGATVTAPSCSPHRPNVGVTTAKLGPGQLQATLTAESLPGAPPNSLSSVRIGSINNAAVRLNGSPVTTGQTVTLPEGSRQATLLLDRHAPDQNPGLASGVGFAVTDACGEWSTFVGGGPSGF
jgi:hypothetical protein